MISKEELQDLYWNQGLSLSQIASITGYGKETIRHHRVKYGIARRNQPLQISKEDLKTLYYKKKMTLKEIAKKLN